MKNRGYCSNMRVLPGASLQEKLAKPIKAAGIADIDFDDKFTAVKTHFGERGNHAFLRPN